MEAFTLNEGVPNYPSTYYGTWGTWKNIFKSALYVAVTLVSDAFIVRVVSTSLLNLNNLCSYTAPLSYGAEATSSLLSLSCYSLQTLVCLLPLSFFYV